MRSLCLVLMLAGTPVLADAPTVENATARYSGMSWSISVTMRHPDTGWDHYADGWQVLAPDGTVLGFRKLLHPHVNEQPFTRSLSGVTVPDGVTHVLIRAHDNVDGWANALYDLALPDH